MTTQNKQKEDKHRFIGVRTLDNNRWCELHDRFCKVPDKEECQCQFCENEATNLRYSPSDVYTMRYDLCDSCKEEHKKAYEKLCTPPPKSEEWVESFRDLYEGANRTESISSMQMDAMIDFISDTIAKEKLKVIETIDHEYFEDMENEEWTGIWLSEWIKLKQDLLEGEKL